MPGWLGACIVLYLACRPFVRRNPAARLFMAGIARILGLRITVVGTPPQRGSLLIANHVSWLDIPALCATSATAFVAHDGLAAIGWLRWLCSLNHTVFVARDRRSSVSRQVEQVREALDEAGTLTIFPEGTTGDGQTLLPFKSSLLSAVTPGPDGLPQDLSVRPVWLDYGPQSPQIAWLDDEPGQANMLRIAARAQPIALTIHFLPPLAPADLTDRKSIAAAAQTAIASAMAGGR